MLLSLHPHFGAGLDEQRKRCEEGVTGREGAKEGMQPPQIAGNERLDHLRVGAGVC